jgi:hypothetical protein
MLHLPPIRLQALADLQAEQEMKSNSADLTRARGRSCMHLCGNWGL